MKYEYMAVQILEKLLRQDYHVRLCFFESIVNICGEN